MPEASPAPYNPPLTPWGESWRLVLSIGISALVWLQVAGPEWDHNRMLFWIDLGLGLISFPLVFLRRRWPLPIAVLLTLFSTVSGASAGPGTLAVVSLATRRRIPQLIAVGVLGVICSQGYADITPPTDSDPRWINLSVVVVVTAAMIISGMYIGSRRELLWSLRERADQAEEQQELRIAQARGLERERIAREMHDVLAHRISLITMHSGALAFRTDLPPEQVRETAQLISTKAHEALVDLREVLGTLRESEPTRPQPTLAELADLVAEATESGMQIKLDNTLADAVGVPDRIGRAVYRVVQEALTNARKHAPGAVVLVGVSGAAGDGLTVSIRNSRRTNGTNTPPGAGLGLVGMRERLELAGGRLDVRDEAGGFALEGWLPWPA